jgi:hypothetical protein
MGATMTAPLEVETVCGAAERRWRLALLLLEGYSALVFVLATGAVLLLLTAMVLFVRNDVAIGAISVAGTAVSGAGAGFILGRRNEAATQELAAYQVYSTCPGGEAAQGRHARATKTLGLF